jgi:RNA polymerase-binding transcription factor DksA
MRGLARGTRFDEAVTSEESAARDRLLGQRARAVSWLATEQARFAELLDDSYVNTDEEHDIEGASLQFERETLRATLREAEARVGEIDAALARVDAGTYGVCEVCGAPIPPERLEARPAAATCVRCASARGRRR